jgi:hypothetical protein
MNKSRQAVKTDYVNAALSTTTDSFFMPIAGDTLDNRRASAYPRTLHCRGGGIFMVSGKSISFRKKFKPQNL